MPYHPPRGPFYCPDCGETRIVLSGNWAGCRSWGCHWQGRVEDVVEPEPVDEEEEVPIPETREPSARPRIAVKIKRDT